METNSFFRDEESVFVGKERSLDGSGRADEKADIHLLWFQAEEFVQELEKSLNDFNREMQKTAKNQQKTENQHSEKSRQLLKLSDQEWSKKFARHSWLEYEWNPIFWVIFGYKIVRKLVLRPLVRLFFFFFDRISGRYQKREWEKMMERERKISENWENRLRSEDGESGFLALKDGMVKRLVRVGSFRQFQELIDKLDFLIETDDFLQTGQYLRGLSGVQRVLEHSEHSLRLQWSFTDSNSVFSEMKTPIEVNFYQVGEEEQGTQMLFSGCCAAFEDFLRFCARRRHLMLRSHGLYDVKKLDVRQQNAQKNAELRRLPDSDSERNVLAALHLPWIPPELRTEIFWKKTSDPEMSGSWGSKKAEPETFSRHSSDEINSQTRNVNSQIRDVNIQNSSTNVQDRNLRGDDSKGLNLNVEDWDGFSPLIEQGKLFVPELIELSDLQGDLHSHSTATDGTGTMKEMSETAMSIGHKYLALTDHSQSVVSVGGMDGERFLRYWEKIDDFNAKLQDQNADFQLLRGAEVDIKEDGGLDLSDDVLAKADWINASIHFGLTQPREQIHRRYLEAFRNPYVCAISHPSGRLLGQSEGMDVDPDFLMENARRYGKILEINSTPKRLDLCAEWAFLAKKYHVPIVISTDAHSTERLFHLRFGVYQARRAGLTKKDVVNTLSWEELFRLKLRLRKQAGFSVEKPR